MVMNLILVWVRFPYSHSDLYRWQLGLLQKEAIQMMNFPLLHRLVYTDVLSVPPLEGELAGTSEPSEIGTSAGSLPSVLSLGVPGLAIFPFPVVPTPLGWS